MRIGVITYPGSLDDRDAQRAIRLAGADPVPLWHADENLKKVDAVVLPGGFSYGDYLRCGAIAAQAPATKEVIKLAGKGLPILGICNGFQVLVESHLLPGGLIRNEHQHFICRDQKLRVENINTSWTKLFEQNQEITIPLKNGEGGYIATPDTLKMLEEENRVVFRYLDLNPNGSMNDIAGLTNERGNVVGLMPHPEHAVEPGFGPDRPEAMRSGVDGLKFFQSVIQQLVTS
jgi:phosphoribosylformylglycinamidine synthase